MQTRNLVPVTLLLSSALLGGCASTQPIGLIYSDIALPMSATGSGSASKQGQASCQSILNVLASGNCTIEAAKKNGELTTISHMDWKVDSVLGIISNYTLTVYGE